MNVFFREAEKEHSPSVLINQGNTTFFNKNKFKTYNFGSSLLEEDYRLVNLIKDFERNFKYSFNKRFP